MALLLKAEGVKLPEWVKIDTSKARAVRNADKRRSTRPAEEVEEAPVAEEAATEVAETAEVTADQPAEEATEA